MTERERLIKAILDNFRPQFEGGGYVADETAYGLADFILADRRRVLDEVDGLLKRDVEILGVTKVNMCVREALSTIERLKG